MELKNELVKQITNTRAELDAKWNQLMFKVQPGKMWLKLLIKLGLRAREPELRYNTERIHKKMNNWEIEKKVLHNDQQMGDKDATDLPQTDPLSGADLKSPSKTSVQNKKGKKKKTQTSAPSNEEDTPSGLSRGPV